MLQHFFLGSLAREEYVEEFVFNYGDWSRGEAESLWNGRARSSADIRYFQFPMLRRMAERSLAIVVHNAGAAAIVRAHSASANVIEIPHLFAPPAPLDRDQIGDARRKLGVARGTFLFGVFGHLRESKRVLSVIRAFRRVHHSGANVRLLIAGECVSSDLQRAMAPMLASPGIVRVGYTEDPGFWQNAFAADACINLRYPPAGETSGIAIRLMGIGKPLLVTAGPEISAFPATACLRVEPGLYEEDMLCEYITWLAAFPDHAREIGQRAAAHITERHSLQRVAEQYWHALVASKA